VRVLHVVKTSDGAGWAADQAAELGRCGVEVHVALPRADGRTLSSWVNSGAHIHIVDLDLPVRRPWMLPSVCRAARQLVAAVQPDIIHSHFVRTTFLMRLALGKDHPVPRIFQVPGPLHLEHLAPRRSEIHTSSCNDYWVGSSACIVRHYLRAGVCAARVFLSYYGAPVRAGRRTGYLRKRLGLADNVKVVGNINLIYPPKRLLGQGVGLKCHEDVIDALGTVLRKRDDVVGVLIGSTFGTADTRYEDGLRKRAEIVGRGRIIMAGYFDAAAVHQSWPDFDCAVHIPMSENCGGVVEPLMAGVPTVASRVGGLPEVVIEGVTGLSVPPHDPDATASAVLKVLSNPEASAQMAANGQRLVRSMFDIERTGSEIAQIYRHILEGASRPPDFFSGSVLDHA